MSYAIDLSRRRALVTGGGRHTGRQFCLALAAAGAEVAVNDILAEKATAVCEEIGAAGGVATPAVFDVTDHAQARDAITSFGPDILVNNVGGTDEIEWPPVPFDQTDPARWQRTIELNLNGPLNCTHAALPAMRESQWGRVITIVSDASRTSERGMAVYAAAIKAGASGFMRAVAAEAGRDGITANCISLGTLLYEGNEPIDEDRLKKALRPYQLTRLGRPTDPVGVLMVLASDAGEWITGQVIPVDGGYTNAL